jgi:hypothetical protein
MEWYHYYLSVPANALMLPQVLEQYTHCDRAPSLRAAQIELSSHRG